MLLDYKNILNYTQDSIEYLFLDKAEIEPGKSGYGTKNLSMQDWFFKMHFPGDPIMPGIFIMEAVMQVGTLIISTMPKKKKKRIVFSECGKVKITGEVRPGDILKLEVTLNKYRRGVASFNGKAFIESEEILNMEFTLVVSDEIILRAEQNLIDI